MANGANCGLSPTVTGGLLGHESSETKLHIQSVGALQQTIQIYAIFFPPSSTAISISNHPIYKTICVEISKKN